MSSPVGGAGPGGTVDPPGPALIADYVAPGQLAMAMPDTVQSVVASRENGPLIAAVATLWIKPDDVVLDVTYGRGNFWTKIRPARLVAHDLELDGVDFRQLPEADASVDVVIFDPPYIAQGGRETSTTPDFLGRYGLVDVPKTVPELNELVAAGMKEASRVLKPKGRLMVKCMDYITAGRLVLGRHHVVTTALGLGLEQVDEFVHYSGTGPQPPRERQIHSRHAHSFLCVFRVPRKPAVITAVPAHSDGFDPLKKCAPEEFQELRRRMGYPTQDDGGDLCSECHHQRRSHWPDGCNYAECDCEQFDGSAGARDS